MIHAIKATWAFDEAKKTTGVIAPLSEMSLRTSRRGEENKRDRNLRKMRNRNSAEPARKQQNTG